MSPLANLWLVRRIALDNNEISDLTPLASPHKYLEHLSLAGNQIVDVSTLQYVPSLQYVGLANNQIADIKGLTRLINLTSLLLDSNAVMSLAPLVANTGIGNGDYLRVGSNVLPCAVEASNIATLLGRGVRLISDCN